MSAPHLHTYKETAYGHCCEVRLKIGDTYAGPVGARDIVTTTEHVSEREVAALVVGRLGEGTRISLCDHFHLAKPI